MEGGAIPELREDQRMYGPFWLGSNILIYFIIAYHNVAGLKCIHVIYAIVSRTMRLPTHPLNLYACMQDYVIFMHVQYHKSGFYKKSKKM